MNKDDFDYAIENTSVIVAPERQIATFGRSEEHTSELQSHSDLVCRLLLEKKKKNIKFKLNIPLQHLNELATLVIIMMANKYEFLQITRVLLLNPWSSFKKVINRRNIHM